MERSEWKPAQFMTKVHPDLCRVVNEALEKCGKETIPVYSGNWSDFAPSGYQWVSIATTDKRKISAMSQGVIQAKAWEVGQGELDNVDKWLEDGNTRAIAEDVRATKGIYIKPGKLLAILGIPNDSCLCSAIADILRIKAEPPTHEIQISNTPSSVYAMQHSRSGSVGGSCMRSENRERFEIYDDLANTQIAYLLDDKSALIGRALLHNVAYSGNDQIKVMDRIYSDCADTEAVFIQYAKENGYWRKSEQVLRCEDYTLPTGETVLKAELYIDCHRLEDNDYTEVPYIDTFAYYNVTNRELHNNSGARYTTYFKETDGSDSKHYIVESSCRCESCRCSLHEDNRCSTNDSDYYYCENCFFERFTRCEICDDYEDTEDCTYIESEGISVCDHCLDRRFTRCEVRNCGEWVRQDDTTTVHDHRGNELEVCEHCLENYTHCDHCEEYFSETTSVTNPDNQEVQVCETCRDDIYTECSECGGYFYNIEEQNSLYYCADCLPEEDEQEETETEERQAA